MKRVNFISAIPFPLVPCRMLPLFDSRQWLVILRVYIRPAVRLFGVIGPFDNRPLTHRIRFKSNDRRYRR